MLWPARIPMRTVNETNGSQRVLPGRPSILFLACLLFFDFISVSSTTHSLSQCAFGFLGVREAAAQEISPAAKSKYDAGMAAMQRGDCQGAKALFKQAIALDPNDRTVRVGMFSTDYRPNASLKAAEAKCPSTPAPSPTPAPTPAPGPAPGPAPIRSEEHTSELQSH